MTVSDSFCYVMLQHSLFEEHNHAGSGHVHKYERVGSQAGVPQGSTAQVK